MVEFKLSFRGKRNALSNDHGPHTCVHVTHRQCLTGLWGNHSELSIPLWDHFCHLSSFSSHVHTSVLCSWFYHLRCYFLTEAFLLSASTLIILASWHMSHLSSCHKYACSLSGLYMVGMIFGIPPEPMEKYLGHCSYVINVKVN
jgi:hypothetical protein